MKIFVIPSWFPPNGGSFFLEQSIVLNEKFEEIVLYVEPMSIREIIKNPLKIKKLFTIEEELIKGLKILRGFNLRVPKYCLPNIHIEQYAYMRLYRYAVKKYGKPNLLHVHSAIWGGWYAYKIKMKYKVPYIITEHRSRFVNNKYAQNENQLPNNYKKYLLKVFSNSSYICPVSSAMIDKIKYYSLDSKVKPIFNMVNEELFFYEEVNKREKFTFITVAGLISLKGIDTLLYAFQKVIEKYPKVELLIIGKGIEKNNLLKISNELNISSQVYFLGNQSRELVARYMKESNVFILPTKYEAFGVVFAEALAMGLPVISTKNSGGPDDFVNSKNGTLVEINNVNELSIAMHDIIENYSEYNNKEIANNAKRLFGKECFQNNYSKIYNKVIDAS